MNGQDVLAYIVMGCGGLISAVLAYRREGEGAFFVFIAAAFFAAWLVVP